MNEPLRPIIAGNWKMNGLSHSLDEASAVGEALRDHPAQARVALFPPATLIERMRRVLEGLPVEVGGQDLHAEACGAFTGDVAADMLVDAGATLVILGHSERRTAYRETDSEIAAKVVAALAAGLFPIVCVGETREQHAAGEAAEVVARQVEGSLLEAVAAKGDRPQAAFAVAYEPIWAIGSGLTPTSDNIAAVHAMIRDTLVADLGAGGRDVPILYGGSVKPDNAAEILRLPEVGGALIGGASLRADDFLAIIRASEAA
jgi:triosephosphate isomerase